MDKKEKRDQVNKKRIRRFCVLTVLMVTCGFTLLQTGKVIDSLKNQTPIILPSPPEVDVTGKQDANEEAVTTEATPTEIPEIIESIEAGANPVTLLIDKVAEGDIVLPFSLDTLMRSKTLNEWRVHNGIDIAGKVGKEVKAVADGTVTDAYFDSQMGYTIILDHGGGFETVYQNLASADGVQKGMYVKAGHVIGAIGNSAAAEMLEESHLHFAVKANGNYVNPIDFMK